MFKLKLSKTVLLLAVLTLQYEQKTTGFRKKRKRKPGKRCAVMFCNETSAEVGVSLHQFPQTLDAGL